MQLPGLDAAAGSREDTTHHFFEPQHQQCRVRVLNGMGLLVEYLGFDLELHWPGSVRAYEVSGSWGRACCCRMRAGVSVLCGHSACTSPHPIHPDDVLMTENLRECCGALHEHEIKRSCGLMGGFDR